MPRRRAPNENEIAEIIDLFEDAFFEFGPWDQDPLIVPAKQDICHEYAVRVRSYLVARNLKFPRWKDLPRATRCKLHGLAASSPIQDNGYISLAVTANISDGQRQHAIQKYGSLRQWVGRDWIGRIRRFIIDYFILLEPRRSRGVAARRYSDSPRGLRRFDIHGILILRNDPELHSRLQNAIRRMHPNYGMEEIPRERWPLFRRGRPAYAKRQYSAGWARYCAKRPDLWPIHEDVIGDTPFLASRDVNFTTKKIYEFIQGLADDVIIG